MSLTNTPDNMFDSLHINENLEHATKSLEKRLVKERKILKAKTIAASVFSLGLALTTDYFMARSMGQDIQNRFNMKDQTIANLETQISNLTYEKNNLITLNEEAVSKMQTNLENMEKQLPGVGSLLPDFDYFINGVERFLKNPRDANELEQLISTPNFAPEDLNEAKYNYIYELHGLDNYIPGGKPLIPNLLPPLVDTTRALVTSEEGFRDFYVYLGNGNEKLLLENQYHAGVDVIHPDRRLIANKEGRVLVFEDADLLPKGEYIHDSFGGLGRLLVVRYDIKGEDGTEYGIFQEFYGHLDRNSGITWKAGDRVHPGDVLGVMGTTGFSSGVHLHWQVFKYNEETGRWPSINPFPTSTYTDQRVYFREETLPESLQRFM